MTFSDVRIGGSFINSGYHYIKLPIKNRPRYGWTNAKGPAFYEGDTGYRYFYDDQKVIILCDVCVSVLGPLHSEDALSATTTMQRESVLLKDKTLSKHVCDEHSAELYDSGWEYV
jgi:hypothetical protein